MVMDHAASGVVPFGMALGTPGLDTLEALPGSLANSTVVSLGAFDG